ncbi:MAG: hypothetical protein ACYDD4_12080 [Acidimicrobiales bacterium]
MNVHALRIPSGGGRLRRALQRRALTPTVSLVTPLAPRRLGPDPILLFDDDLGVPDGESQAYGIPNALLSSEDVPHRGCSAQDLGHFAASYDGYKYWSDVNELGERARRQWRTRGTVPQGLDQLRGCLFAEHRRWHHLGEMPAGDSARYVWALVDAVRDHVTMLHARQPSAAVLPEPPSTVLPPPPPTLTTVAEPLLERPARAGRPAPRIDVFSGDDAGFASWTAAHEDGYVVNAASAKTLKLHHASCASVQRSSTSRSRKVCGAEVGALVDWCIEHFGNDPEPCGRCNP